MVNTMKMTSYKMPDEMIDRLDRESERTGAPKSEIVRRAVDSYLRHSDGHQESGATIEAASISPMACGGRKVPRMRRTSAG